jgi:pimeloyl-ACP methyl ester carboxylesterase
MRLSANRRIEGRGFGYHNFGATVGLLGSRPGVVDVVRFGQGDPIVVLPGLAGGWKLLAPLARRLASRAEVFLLGFRGDHGTLTAGLPESIGEYAEDVAHQIAELGLVQPTVVGVSFGGVVALELALEYPEHVGSLFLHGADCRFQGGLGALIARRVLERFPLPDDNRFVNQFFNLLHGCRPEPGPLAEFVVQSCWETDQAVMASRLRALDGFDVTDRLWAVDAPTLVIAGSRDVIVTPSRQRALAAAIPQARFELIEGAGHVGFLTHGALVASKVCAHLRARSA